MVPYNMPLIMYSYYKLCICFIHCHIDSLVISVHEKIYNLIQ